MRHLSYCFALIAVLPQANSLSADTSSIQAAAGVERSESSIQVVVVPRVHTDSYSVEVENGSIVNTGDLLVRWDAPSVAITRAKVSLIKSLIDTALEVDKLANPSEESPRPPVKLNRSARKLLSDLPILRVELAHLRASLGAYREVSGIDGRFYKLDHTDNPFRHLKPCGRVIGVVIAEDNSLHEDLLTRLTGDN